MEPKKTWLLILLIGGSVVFFAAFGVLLFKTMSESKGKPVGNPFQSAANEELNGVGLKIPGNDKDGYWDLDLAKLERSNQLGYLTSIKGIYYKAKRSVYQIAGNSGIINWQTRVLQVNGSVIFKSNDGKAISADQIIWDPIKNRITAQGRVILKTPEVQMSTDAIWSDLAMEKSTFLGMTRVTFRR